MGMFSNQTVTVTFGSKRAEDGRWTPRVVKREGEDIFDLSPSEAFQWRSTAYRKAKALARSKINLHIPLSTPESRTLTASEVVGWCYSDPQKFITMWRAEFTQFTIGARSGKT